MKVTHTQLTAGQAAFVEAKLRGANHTAAAIAAGYATRTAKQAGSKMAAKPHVRAELARRRAELPQVVHSDPLVYLRALMNDPQLDLRLRCAAAKALLPYCHAPLGSS